MFITVVIVAISTILLFHAIFTVVVMAFSWNDPLTVKLRKSPHHFRPARHSFTLLLPVRNEPKVIGDTLRAMAKINYSADKWEVLVMCRQDDESTMKVITATLHSLQLSQLKLIVVGTDIDNKPKALNIGLKNAQHQIVTVFDAEDEPHPDILHVVNTVVSETNADVIQSGVQLMNFRSNWFATLNVLEYYFWFKSILHFYAKHDVVPLGGNTVFIKKAWLEQVGGWSEHILTEDADLGIRLSAAGAQFRIVYDEQHATQEETPETVPQFIKQRTRWNQGFLQIFMEGKWLSLDGLLRKLLTGYILVVPFIQAIWFIYLPLMVFSNFLLSIPVGWALFSLLPGYILVLQLVLYNYGLWSFCRDYHKPYNLLFIFKVFFTFFPYQFLMSIAAMRAVYRMVLGNHGWEKTAHSNAHRIGAHAP